MTNLFYGVLYGFVAQVVTFLQLQGSIKYGWFDRYPLLTLIISVPLSYCYIKSVQHLVTYAGGEIWPSRLIGFAVGIIVFTSLSYFLFKETLTLKTLVCLFLSMCILGIQIFWK